MFADLQKVVFIHASIRNINIEHDYLKKNSIIKCYVYTILKCKIFNRKFK